MSRNLNRRNCPLGSLLVSVDLTSDEISATGGRQRFALDALGMTSWLGLMPLQCQTEQRFSWRTVYESSYGSWCPTAVH